MSRTAPASSSASLEKVCSTTARRLKRALSSCSKSRSKTMIAASDFSGRIASIRVIIEIQPAPVARCAPECCKTIARRLAFHPPESCGASKAAAMAISVTSGVILLDIHRAIKSIALHGTETGVTNRPAQFFFVRLVRTTRGGHHIFLDQNTAEIVAAEAQGHLSQLDAGGEPTRLHVLEIIEVNARNRQRLQVIDRRGFLLDEPPQRCPFALEHPRNEGGETAGFFLQLANALEMAHAMLEALAASEHHRSGGTHAQFVRGAMHGEPIFGGALQPADAETHFVVENFRAAAGNGVETRGAQPDDGFANRESADFGDTSDFRRRETVQMNRRKAILDGTEQILVPFDLQVGVETALHQHAGAAEVERLLDFCENRFLRENVAVGRLHRLVEIAERAVFRAEIRVVDVAIDLICDDAFGMQPLAHSVGGQPEPLQVGRGKHVHRLLVGNHFAASSPARTISRSRPSGAKPNSPAQR